MKPFDGQGLFTLTLTCALTICLVPGPSPAQYSGNPGGYAADPDMPPYLAPKPKPLRNSYVEPLAPPAAPSSGSTFKARRAKKAGPANAVALVPESPAKFKLVSQPKPPDPRRTMRSSQPPRPGPHRAVKPPKRGAAVGSGPSASEGVAAGPHQGLLPYAPRRQAEQGHPPRPAQLPA